MSQAAWNKDDDDDDNVLRCTLTETVTVIFIYSIVW